MIETTDWKALGLKCGIEIHQELEGRKLFCHCPTLIRKDLPHRKTYRMLRAAAGESGLIDIAAKQEMQKQRVFVYESYNDTNCMVELDEEPPQTLNSDALRTSLLFSKMVGARFVDGIKFMRKTIVDGSNTSGFQRTGLVAMNGKLATSFGDVGIHTVILEEDSARHISDSPEEVVFCLDRLGIPLIEVCTAPAITHPKHVTEVAEKIGLLLRSTGQAKRGLGTIRQDVNVSIARGTRVEIKGAQDLKLLSELVKVEALRQKKLLEIKDVLAKRKVKEQKPAIINVTGDLSHTGAKVIRSALENKGVVLACKIAGFNGMFGVELQPGKRFGTECSERAKIIANVGGIFHSDELPKYGITEHEVNSIKGTLLVGVEDGFVMVAAQPERAKRAIEAVIDRINEALTGIPKEVRKANDDGTTSYLRPMPTAERMYPETDVPLIPLSQEFVDSIKLPELIEQRQARYEKLGLSKDVAELAARSQEWQTFDGFIIKYTQLKPAYVAEIFFGAARAVKTQFNIDITPLPDDFDALFAALAAEKISKESILDILKENKPVSEIIDNFMMISDKELENKIKELAAKNKNVPPNALIGIAMKELRGKAAGSKISEMIRKNVL
ncbi:MAG: Glu-tRNA(Gln) amidotransferase subunit GatE [Candidatus Aenigmarchaeota archaeon]|nr:Glu-tRNA(Gln) amidotransferase subunit GatE [Candidatus Aenigmarchaeota archaeon]